MNKQEPEREPDLDLLAALGELPPRQRAAVALFYLEDRPVDEIADLMEVSAGGRRCWLTTSCARR